MALYGAGSGTAVRELARAFAVGSPGYQEVMADREVYKRQLALAPKEEPAAAAAPVSSDIDHPAFAKTDGALGERDLAVVIGVEKYQALPASDFSSGDAALVKAYLQELGIQERNIVYLTNEKATFSAIRKAVEAWLPNRLEKGGRVFFYFSGHGAPDPATGQAYLVPFDGDPNYLVETGYPLKRLYEKLGKLAGTEIAVVLDSCFSGAGGRSVLAKGARPLVMTAEAQSLPANLAVLTGSRGAQISSASAEKGHGILTYYFLKALKEGKRSLAEIYLYSRPRVEDEARRMNIEQNPGLSPSPEKLKGRFIFRR